jgi:hypothetical protein
MTKDEYDHEQKAFACDLQNFFAREVIEKTYLQYTKELPKSFLILIEYDFIEFEKKYSTDAHRPKNYTSMKLLHQQPLVRYNPIQQIHEVEMLSHSKT